MAKNEANTLHLILGEPLIQKMNPLGRLFAYFHVNDSNIGFEWIPKQNINVFWVSQDDPLQEVFRDALGVFYATTKLPHLQLVAQ